MFWTRSFDYRTRTYIIHAGPMFFTRVRAWILRSFVDFSSSYNQSKMKLLFVCVLLIAGAFVVKGAHEVCGLDNDQIMALVKCMGDHATSELKGKAKEIISKLGDNVAELLKKPCDADVDFGEALKAIATPEEAEAVKKAYAECKQS